MKVAIVHDWLTGMRGGEKVLEVLCELFPRSDLYTLVHKKGSTSRIIEDRAVRTSFIQKLPWARSRYRYYLPLFPLAVEGLDLRGYELVLSSSHCAAKGVITSPGSVHISYVHTPMRYVWDMYQDYFGNKRFGSVSSAFISVFSNYLRMWDVTSSSRVDHFVANSRHVAERIKKYYRRDSFVIHPPVDCSRFHVSRKVEDFYLVVSALAPYKRVDIAVDAFNRSDLKLKIIGTGQDEKRLKKMAGPGVEFLGWKADAQVADYYSRTRALIFPGVEDFGITPLEAMASGRPVIAFGRGGVLETVTPLNDPVNDLVNAPTGVFFHEQNPDSLLDAVRSFEKNIDRFSPEAARTRALEFDRIVFKEKISEFIEERVQKPPGVLRDVKKAQSVI